MSACFNSQRELNYFLTDEYIQAVKEKEEQFQFPKGIKLFSNITPIAIFDTVILEFQFPKGIKLFSN